MLRHPSGAGEIPVMDTARSFRLGNGIDAENDGNRFTPVGAISGCVEHAHIELHVLTVIVGEHRTLWRFIQEAWLFHRPIPNDNSISGPRMEVNGFSNAGLLQRKPLR